MKPPKTAALWALLERLGWRHDSLPISTVMASHEAVENELAGVNEDLEFRRGLYALQTQRMERLENELGELKQERLTLLSDDGRQSAEIIHLKAKLAAERALADEMAGQLEHACFAHDPGGCQKMFEAWKAARDESRH